MRKIYDIQSGEMTDAPNEPPLINEAEQAEEIKQAAKAELATIDAASVRAIREYIANKSDAPQILKDKEAAAIAARNKLK